MRTILLAACWLAAFISIAVKESLAVGPDFVSKNVRMCLKPGFVINLAELSLDQCADACRKRTPCQGFKHDSNYGCELFTFDRCSHDINEKNCVRTDTVWVRNHPRLPEGTLCPATYDFRHGTSKYHIQKLESTGDWNRGMMYCTAEPGLTKYADASDSEETKYLRQIQKDLKISYYVGGITGGLHLKGNDKSSWRWVSCGTPILDEVWEEHQPNDVNHLYACMWNGHRLGIDNHVYGSDDIKHALCECTDPFFD